MPSLYAHDKEREAPSGLLLGLGAKKQRGKDTMADYLCAYEGFTRLSFAEPMYRCAAAALGCTVEDLQALKEDPHAYVICGQMFTDLGVVAPVAQITVRKYLQLVGTEAHRQIPEFGDSVWIDMMRAKIKMPGRYVITDARFKNEQELVKELGGYVIGIERPGMDEGDGHASEQVDHGLTDYVIANDSSLEVFCQRIDNLLTHIREARAVGT